MSSDGEHEDFRASGSPEEAVRPTLKKRRSSPPADDSKPKAKRKQLSSCDTCRLRRVKCIRDSEDEPCEPCKAKAINCTSEYITQAKQPKAQRAGRLIIKAKEQFGVAAEPSPPVAGPSQPEISPELAAHLAERYFSLIHFQLPVLAWDSFASRLAAANYDPTKLTDTGEALCWVVLAFGARVSDSPAILGPDAPNIASLRERTRRGEDLGQWGRAREPFCQMMLERAVRKVDEHAIMRKPSVDSISALILLCYLVEHGDAHHSRGRMYSAVAYEQLRALVSQHSPLALDDKSEEAGLLKGGRIFWCCFVKDSLVAAHTGRAPQFTETDILCFCPAILETTHDVVRAALQESDPAKVARAAALGLFGQVAMLGRSVNEHLSGPIARRRPQLDLEFIEHKFWTDIEVSAELCAYFRSRLEELFPIRAGTFELWIRTLIICRLALVAHVDALLRDHLVAGEIAYGVSPATEPEYLAAVQKLAKRSSALLFKCMLQTMEIVKTAALTGVAIGGGLLLNNLSRYASLVLHTPTEEEGGGAVSGFTMALKMEYLHWMNAALRSLGWSWDDGQASIAQITTALEGLREKAKAMGESMPQLSAMQSPSTAPPITPVSSMSAFEPPKPEPDFTDTMWESALAGAPMPLLFPENDSMWPTDAASPSQNWTMNFDELLQPSESFAWAPDHE